MSCISCNTVMIVGSNDFHLACPCVAGRLRKLEKVAHETRNVMNILPMLRDTPSIRPKEFYSILQGCIDGDGALKIALRDLDDETKNTSKKEEN